jgi:hypothetical protein
MARERAVNSIPIVNRDQDDEAVPTASEYRATPLTYADGDPTIDQADIHGNKKVTMATTIAGEDLTNDVMKTEGRYSYETSQYGD